MRRLVIAVVVLVLAGACASDPDIDLAVPTTVPTSTTPPSTTAATSPPPTTVPPTPSLAAGDHEFTIDSVTGERRYLVHVPAGLADGPSPVVMSLHGGGGSAPQHKGQIGLDVVADREGFVAVYPDGNGATRLHTWNAGSYCCGVAARQDIDDVAFLAEVLEDLSDRMSIDADRVVVAGHSNGAMMAGRFAGERPELVSAVVGVGAVPAPDQVPSVPVPFLQIHSVDDPRALYEGGEGPPFPGTNSTVVHVGVMETVAAWAAANGCDEVPVESAPVVATNGHTATWVEWEGCAARTAHYRLTGAGHGWPGVLPSNESLVGPGTDVVIASEEVWRFASEVFADS